MSKLPLYMHSVFASDVKGHSCLISTHNLAQNFVSFVVILIITETQWHLNDCWFLATTQIWPGRVDLPVLRGAWKTRILKPEHEPTKPEPEHSKPEPEPAKSEPEPAKTQPEPAKWIMRQHTMWKHTQHKVSKHTQHLCGFTLLSAPLAPKVHRLSGKPKCLLTMPWNIWRARIWWFWRWT